VNLAGETSSTAAAKRKKKDKLGGNLSFYRRGRDAVSLPAPSWAQQVGSCVARHRKGRENRRRWWSRQAEHGGAAKLLRGTALLHGSANTTSLLWFFLFKNYSQFQLKTSKTCNMKVVQNNKSYNFAFEVISEFQIFLKLRFSNFKFEFRFNN
jgi:hypothetical protein